MGDDRTLFMFMHTKMLIEGLPFVQSSKIPAPGEF